MYDVFFQPVKSIISIKETAEKALKRLGILNVRDLVFYKPYSYNISDTSSNLSGLRDNLLIQAEVSIIEISQSRSGRAPTKIYVGNDTGGLTLVFFNKIPTFIFSKLKVGGKYTVQGKVQYFDGGFQLTHPEFIFKKSLSVPVEPIYHLTYGLINKQLYDYILTAIKSLEVAIAARNSFGKIPQECSHYITSLINEIKQLHLVDHAPIPLLIEQTMESVISKLTEKELFANQITLAKLKKRSKRSLAEVLILQKSLRIRS